MNHAAAPSTIPTTPRNNPITSPATEAIIVQVVVGIHAEEVPRFPPLSYFVACYHDVW
jgi:hypothetical protein